MKDLLAILKTAVSCGASEIRISADNPPMMRINDGPAQAFADMPVLSARQAEDLVYSALYDEQRAKLAASLVLDASFAIKDCGRFQMKVTLMPNGVYSVIRVVP